MGESVEFPSNGGTCPGYLAVPEKEHGPGLIVIQEWWGLVPHIRNVCDRFAGEGLVALAPDLYHGEEAKEPDDAQKLAMQLQLDGAARDMIGAGRWLAGDSRTDGDRVGIVGFCMGGALAVYAATLSDVFAAAVAFYPGFGRIDPANPDWNRVGAAVQGHFAEHDHAYTRERVEQFEAQLHEAGVATDFHWYEAGHAFFNDDRPQVYNEDAARDAWDRTVAFFRKHLGGAAATS